MADDETNRRGRPLSKPVLRQVGGQPGQDRRIGRMLGPFGETGGFGMGIVGVEGQQDMMEVVEGQPFVRQTGQKRVLMERFILGARVMSQGFDKGHRTVDCRASGYRI